MGNETLQAYFGFMYTPRGQLLFLLVAGNLAWSTGVLGIVAAAVTNFNAASAWYTGQIEGAGSPGALPSLGALSASLAAGVSAVQARFGGGRGGGGAATTHPSHARAAGGADDDEML